MSALELDATHPPIFHFTDEHAALRAVLRKFFTEPTAANLHADNRPPDTDWRRLVGDIGVGDILFHGDAGETVSTPIDLAIVAEEAGAALYDGPLLSTAVLGPLLTEASLGRPALAARLRECPRAALGAELLTGGPTGLTGTRDEDGIRVSGSVEPVCDLDDLHDSVPIVCMASIDGTPTAVVLLADAPGVHTTTLRGLDPSRSLGRIECRDATTEFALADADATAALRRRGDLVIAAELLGTAQWAFDQTVDYVSRRIQFGRTIGSFQAIKHRLADLLTQVELTRSAVYGAAWRLTIAPDDIHTDIDLAVAAAQAADTATTVTKAAIQLHGGIAITWDHWAHRYFRRAHSVVALTGGAPAQRRWLADLIDIKDGQHG